MNALIGAIFFIVAVLIGCILFAVAAGAIQKAQRETNDPKAFSPKAAVLAFCGIGVILFGVALGVAAFNGVYLW